MPVYLLQSRALPPDLTMMRGIVRETESVDPIVTESESVSRVALLLILSERGTESAEKREGNHHARATRQV
ncbi:hypothetical protein WDU94_011300 [Cyamophila willieti]